MYYLLCILNSFLIKQIWYPGIIGLKPPKVSHQAISLDSPYSGWECSAVWVPRRAHAHMHMHTHTSYPKNNYQRRLYSLTWYQVSISFSTVSVDSFSYLLWSPLPAILALYVRRNMLKLFPTLSLAGGPNLQSLETLLRAGYVSLSIYNLRFYGVLIANSIHM